MVAWWMVAMATGIVAVLLSGIGLFLPASGGSASEGRIVRCRRGKDGPGGAG